MGKRNISPIYKILLLFEDVQDPNSNIAEGDYLSYLDRLYIQYLGAEKREIYETIRGLHTLGAQAEHSSVKRAVFHLIELIEKEAV